MKVAMNLNLRLMMKGVKLCDSWGHCLKAKLSNVDDSCNAGVQSAG